MIAPRWRSLFLILGFVSLAFGVAGGLARLAPMVHAPGPAIAWHGMLMVSAFLGTVISLERAVALRRLWGYAGPLAAGLGGVLVLSGAPGAGWGLLVLAAALLCAANMVVVARQPALETAVLLGGALAWLAGNAIFLFGDGTPWWIAFFALTIGGERLELSRYARRSAVSRRAFAAIALALLFAPLVPRVLGAALAMLGLWLATYDLARVTVRQRALPRYIAVCLLAGYFWLVVAGAVFLLQGPRDAALHAVFLGFVFSMIFGHAAVILPAVLRVSFPYRPILYLPLVVLHVSLFIRVLGGLLDAGSIKSGGAWGNAAAIALFIAVAAFLVLFDRGQRTRPARV
ncbi:MAG: hypothetical protein ACM30H_01610 [Clostridia bacterium]